MNTMLSTKSFSNFAAIAFLLASASCPAREPIWEWEAQDCGDDTSIRALCGVDEKVCWFGTAKGTIGRTIDGGKMWERFVVADAEDVEFRDVEAFDVSRCVAMSVGEGKAS